MRVPLAPTWTVINERGISHLKKITLGCIVNLDGAQCAPYEYELRAGGVPLFVQLNGRDHSNSIVPGNNFGRGKKPDGSICIQWQVRVR